MMLYEALEKSMNRDHSEELLKDLVEARKKKKKRRSPRASGSSQVPPIPPPPPSTNQEGQSHGSTAPSSSKTAASAEYKAWTTTNTRLRLSGSSTPEDLQMDDDMAPDAQAHSSDDEDIRNAHIPKVNLRQDWWKPLEEDRPATPEPSWSILSSDVLVPKNNWESALASTYSPPLEESLLAQTADMAMFMDWFCKRQGITKLKPQDLEGPVFAIVKILDYVLIGAIQASVNDYLMFLSNAKVPECSSCGTLYTRDCSCSKGSVEDKILVPKPPKNCARCGHPINCSYCQGCTLLRETLEEDLVTYFQSFQNTSESSDGSTNVVNAPREPFVVKQDHGVNPPHINECCCECGEALDGIICQQCACKSCGKCAHIGYNCPPKVPIISNPEPCNQTMNNEPPQTLSSFDPMCYSKYSSPCVSKPNFVDESSNIFNPPLQPPIYSCEFYESNAQYGHYCTPQAPFINSKPGYSQDFNFSQDIHNFQPQYICCDQCGDPHETFQCQQVISCEPCCEDCGGPYKNFQCQPLNYYQPNPIYDSIYSGFDQFGDFHPQQHLCCENCGGLHETSQCQPMNQNFYNSNSSGFDQTQPTQFLVVHPPPQETSIKISHDQENIINYVQTFLRKFNRYSFFKTPKVLLLAWDRVSEIKDAFENKQYKPEDIQELFRKLLDNLQNIHEELAEFINSSGWNRPAVYDDDDDDVDYTIAITPVLSTEKPDNSLSMRDEHLDTIPATESDEVIKSSVENLIPIPSEFKGIPNTLCDVHLVNNPTTLETKDHFEIVINSNDNYSSSDDDSLYYENIEYVEASPYDSELVSLEVEKIVIPEDEEIEDDNLR
nr:hypothetical protein [Tanacetum cinerariifolium]